MPPVTIYISEKDMELVEKLRHYADRELRSFSNVCLLAFKEFLEKNAGKIEIQKILPFPQKNNNQ